MVLAVTTFSIMIALIRHLTVKFSTFEIVFYRAVIGVIVMLPWLARAGVKVLKTPRLSLLGIRAVLAFIAMTAYFHAIGLVPLADAIALQFALPLFTVTAAGFFLGERVGLHRAAAAAVGFVGAMIIVRPGIIETDTGALLVLISAAFYSGSHILVKYMTRWESPDLIVFYGFLMTIPMALVPALFVWTLPVWSDLPWLIGMGLIGTVAHTAMARAYAWADASLVAPLDFLRLPIGAALGFVFFSEWPDYWTWVGAAVIFAATTYIAQRGTARKGRVS